MLKKERPKDPQYFYIYILVTQLLSRIYKSRAPGQSQVFGQMALKMTLKAVETTFRNGDDNVPVNSSQILRFIIQILREQGAYQELYSTLYDLQMEKKTSLKSDIEFIRARLDCLASNQRWKDLGTVGILLVTNAAARREPWTYDWTVWEHTALGNVELDSAR